MHVFITGVSQGLGKALAEHFLSKGDSVIGIGRSHSFKDINFSFIKCDLEDVEAVNKIAFDILDDNILLINNAGIVGSIKRVSDQNESDILPVITVNSIAPMLLCQKLLKATSLKTNLTIINISSGAAKRAIPSWASYCASKAALEIFSETIYLEEMEKGRNIKVYSVSPGVLDTSMQEKIRSAKVEDFSSLDNFRELKATGQLLSPEIVVGKMMNLLQKEYSGQVIYSLKEY